MAQSFIDDVGVLSVSRLLPSMQYATLNGTTYFGVRAVKNPLDAWVYQEIICECRPDVIIEIGNASGGGTLFLAHICSLLGHGRVIGVDANHRQIAPVVAAHPLVTLVDGDACGVFADVAKLIGDNEDVLIIEDSAHTYDNTLNVLRRYSPLVKPGGYFIVEDGICHHGLATGPNPGPYEAVAAFLGENRDFISDRSRERFVITWNPRGFLKRRGLTNEGDYGI